jgi:FkbM family methyltransferase
MMNTPSLFSRAISPLVASYPIKRGRTRLRGAASAYLVGKLPFGAWVRVSGVVDAEWGFLQGGGREDDTTAVLRSLLHPGAVFVDVGANVGYFTLLAAKLGADVIAYEPTPSVFRRLAENVELNSLHAKLVNAAAMDRAGRFPLYLSEDDPEANSLFGSGGSVTVSAVRLDDDLASRGISRVDVLKIDAEGAEPLVLDGARKLLDLQSPALIMELNPFALEVAGYTPSDVYSRLQAHGYSVRVIEWMPYKGRPCQNILAVKRATEPGVRTPTA